jgi:TPR repeat protein
MLIKACWAYLMYRIGALLFLSGIGRLHQSIHGFAMRCLQRAANADNVKALLLFGQLLKYRGVSIPNRLAGVQYLRKAADKGLIDAQFMLAEALCDDTLLIKASDEKEILALYTQAAEQGHVVAALRLKKAYGLGLWGVPVDKVLANYWSEQFMKSSKQ